MRVKHLIFMLAFLIFVPMILFAQTNHTISVDGTINTASGETWSTTNENFTTSTGSSAFITWDANWIYVAWSQIGFDGWNQACYIVIDTDPQYAPNQVSGNGTSNLGYDVYFRGSTVNAPFNADYIFMVKENSSTLEEHAWWHDGSNWVIDATTPGTDHRNSFESAYGNPGGSSDIEFRISRNALGIDADASRIYLIAYCKDLDSNSGWGWLYGAVPENATIDGDNDKTFSHYYGFVLTSGVNPNSVNNFDQSLPVELASFTAHAGDSEVILRWVTESEIENDAFILERSSDGENFTMLDEIPGHGSSSEQHVYSFVDQNVINGLTYYYRLSDRDYNGTITTHNVITAVPNGAGIVVTGPAGKVIEQYHFDPAYPNPFNPETTLRFAVPNDDGKVKQVRLHVYNMLGQRVATLYDGPLAGGEFSMKWNGLNDAGQSQPSGVYILRFSSRDYVDVQRVVLLR